MSRSSKGRKYFNPDKYNIARQKTKGHLSSHLFGGDQATLQDFQVSRDRRRFKASTQEVGLDRAHDGVIELDDVPMDLDFGIDEGPDDLVPCSDAVEMKQPKKRYFVSVSLLSRHGGGLQEN